MSSNPIAELTQLLKDSFEDFLMTRKERQDIKAALLSMSLTQHQRQLLWHEAKETCLHHNGATKTDAIEWLYEVGKLLNNRTENSAYIHSYFSPGTACREAIRQQIAQAHHSMDICVFTISDDGITHDLMLAHKMGKKVRIITDNDKSNDLGSDIDRMAHAGIKVVKDNTSAHMHHKFAVFDNKRLLTGSYNWTRSAADYNHENVLLTDNSAAIQAFSAEFEKLWQELS